MTVTAVGGLCPPPTTGLVSCWAAEGNYLDSGPGGNNGTPEGGVGFGPGKVGSQAFSMTSTGSYVDIGDPASLKLTSAITIAAWVNPSLQNVTNCSPDYASVITKWAQGPADAYAIWLCATGSSNSVLSWIHLDNGSYDELQGGSLPNNAWSHVAITYDEATGLYNILVNGVQVASSTIQTGHTIQSTDAGVRIGSEDSGLAASRQFLGKIDDARIYSQALSCSEVQQLAEVAQVGCAPTAPTGVTATAGDQQASVSWTASDDGGVPIAKYTVTEATGGTKKVTVTCPPSPTVCPTAATVTGLTNGTSYTFTVTATNAVGTSPPSTASSPVTPVPDTLTPPTNVSAMAGDQQAVVTWTASSSPNAIVSYTVTEATGGTKKVTVTCPPSPTVCPTTATVTGLTNGTPYTFTVHAKDNDDTSAESAPSNQVTPKPDVLAAPTNPVAVAGNGKATVTWTASAGGPTPIVSYTVTASGGQKATVPCSPPGTCPTVATVGGLTNGAAYTFTVHAKDNDDTSAESNASNSVTPGPMVLSGTLPPSSSGVQKVNADVGGAACAGASVNVPKNATTFANLSVAATCGVDGQAVTISIGVTAVGLTGAPAPATTCLVFATGTTLTGIALQNPGTPNTNCGKTAGMALSGTLPNSGSAQTITAQVGGVDCGTAAIVVAAGNTTFTDLQLEASCGIVGQAVTLFIDGSAAGLTGAPAPHGTCVALTADTNLAGIVLVPNGTPDTSCATHAAAPTGNDAMAMAAPLSIQAEPAAPLDPITEDSAEPAADQARAAIGDLGKAWPGAEEAAGDLSGDD